MQTERKILKRAEDAATDAFWKMANETRDCESVIELDISAYAENGKIRCFIAADYGDKIQRNADIELDVPISKSHDELVVEAYRKIKKSW